MVNNLKAYIEILLEYNPKKSITLVFKISLVMLTKSFSAAERAVFGRDWGVK